MSAASLDGDTVTHSDEETESFGERLAGSVSSRDVLYLTGELGAGKTTLVRGLARGLGASGREVASPTFALLHEYASAGEEIVLRHLDLFRLEDRARELEVLGLPDAVAGAPVCVEWPGEAIRTLLPPTIEIALSGLGDTRTLRLRRLVTAASGRTRTR